jgi:hypothetical protein
MSTSDSDYPGGLHKNGHDRLQDRDINALRTAVDALEVSLEDKHEKTRTAFEAFKASNDRTHQEIAGNIRTGTTVGRLLWGLVFIFVTSLGGLLGYGFGRFDDLQIEVQTLKSFQAADSVRESSQNRIDDRHDREIKVIREQMRQDREQIRQHHERNGSHRSPPSNKGN